MWLLLLLILSISSPSFASVYGDYERKSSGGLSSICVEDEGVSKGCTANTFNFTGGVSAVVTGDTATVNITGGSGSGSTENTFETIDVPAGTDPVAESATDTLTITETTTPLVITGTAASDTIDITWTTLGADQGGTGATSLTDGGILLGSGTGAITPLGVAANGQIPIGDGTTDPVLATITGTTNEVTVANGAGTITLDIPDPLIASKGGTGITVATDDTTIVGNGSTFGGALLPNCTDASGNHLNYTQSSNAFSCGTTSSVASVWQTTSNVANLVTGGDTVTIGSSTGLAKLAVDGDADEAQLLVQFNATQTTPPFVLEQSDGTNVATADTSGASVWGGAITTSGTEQSTITEGLIVNQGQGTNNDDDFQVLNSSGTNILLVDVSAQTITSAVTSSIGWTAVDGADNTAGNDQCASACIFGVQNATGVAVTGIVSCSDSSADTAVCAGSS